MIGRGPTCSRSSHGKNLWFYNRLIRHSDHLNRQRYIVVWTPALKGQWVICDLVDLNSWPVQFAVLELISTNKSLAQFSPPHWTQIRKRVCRLLYHTNSNSMWTPVQIIKPPVIIFQCFQWTIIIIKKRRKKLIHSNKWHQNTNRLGILLLRSFRCQVFKQSIKKHAFKKAELVMHSPCNECSWYNTQ